VEDDDVVDVVQKLRAEVLFHLVGDFRLHPLVVRARVVAVGEPEADVSR
jgi:hypothetical protein